MHYLHKYKANWTRPRSMAAVLSAAIVTGSPTAPALAHFDLVSTTPLDQSAEGRYAARLVSRETPREHDWPARYVPLRRAA
jgi:hypothetical protein